jgi:hypothetical protein
MASAVAYKPVLSENDLYQSSVSTNYYKDQTTGKLFLSSGTNTRTIIPEQFKTAKLIGASASASNTTTSIYTIPAGKVFILTSAQVCTNWNNAIALLTNFGNLRYQNGGVPVSIIRTFACPAQAGSVSSNLNPSSILVFDENFTFEVSSNSANMNCGGCILGYEIDKSEYLGVFN